MGSVIEFDGTTLPIGYEWPNGQTLSGSINYPDYFAALGTLATLDRREYVAIAGDMGTVSPGRIQSGIVGIDPTTIGSAGGIQANAIMISNLPAHSHAAYIRDPTHFHVVNGLTNPGGFSVAPGGVVAPSPGPVSVNTAAASTGIHVNNGVGGGGTDDVTGDVGGGVPTNNCQPSIIKNFILVVE